MPTISFHLKEIVEVVEKSKALFESEGGHPTMDQLFDGSFYPGGTPLNEGGMTESECLSRGGSFWPSASHMNTSRIPFVLKLVGDHGVYIMTNANAKVGVETPKNEKLVYAKGCNPSTDIDFYDNKCHLFGGNDGSVTIPVDWVRISVERGKRVFSLSLTSKSIKLN